MFADRHPRIRKLMTVNPLFNDIKHQFYPWHAAEGICKSLDFTNFTPKSDFSIHEKKKMGKLLQWIPSILNHFRWSVSTSNKDPQVLYEKVII